MSGMSTRAPETATPTPTTTEATSGPVCEAETGNQATQQSLGLQSGGGGAPSNPPDPTTQVPTVPYVVLTRGTAANQGAVAAWANVVEAVLAGWNQPFDASSVVLAGESTVACEPIIALLWNNAWGALPSLHDMPPSVSPLDARVAMTIITATNGWGQLDSGKQAQLAALLGGETNTLSAAARRRAQTFVADPGWSGQSAEEQAAILEGLINDRDARPALVDEPHPEITEAPHTLTGPTLETGHAFRGVTADADVWVCRFDDDGKTVTIYAPHAPDPANGHHYTVQQAVHALVRLPAASRAVVTTITLNAARNPEDPHWAVEYNDPNFESFMTAGAAGDITIYPAQGSPVSQTYTDDTMVHETGHTWSKQQWGEDTTADSWKPWRDAMAADGVSVSNYATASIDEDVAETIQVYNTTKGTPQHDEYAAMVPNRFAILERHF